MSDFSKKFDGILEKINILAERYVSAKEENGKLVRENMELKEKLSQLEKDLKVLKVAKSISSTDDNPEETKKKINEFIREIDKCIAMLNN